MQDIIGAIKIKDGLFIGDQYAAQDLEFVVGNKVSHIINCSGKQVPNHWEPIGVKYLTFTWQDSPGQILLDQADKNFTKICNFIESAEEECTSVLVHCINGLGRSVVVVASYLMKRFSWNLYKTLQFLNSRRGNIELKSQYLSQLSSLEQRLNKMGKITKSSQWGENCRDIEEQVLQNTFINSHLAEVVFGREEVRRTSTKKIAWAEGEGAKDKVENGNFIVIRSCLKGGNKEEVRVPRVVRGGPKRSISLNLPKSQKKDENKLAAFIRSPEKNLPLFRYGVFRDIIEEAGDVVLIKPRKTGFKRPVTAPDKKVKKTKAQSSIRVVKKSN